MPDDNLTHDQFLRRAQELGVTEQADLAELWPMVQNLLTMARRVGNALPELHQDVEVGKLSRTATGD